MPLLCLHHLQKGDEIASLVLQIHEPAVNHQNDSHEGKHLYVPCECWCLSFLPTDK